MNTYVHILAIDIKGIIESVVKEKCKGHINGKIDKIDREDIMFWLPGILINRLDSPLLELQLNEFDNILWSNKFGIRYKYEVTVNDHLFDELINKINQLIDFENAHPKYFKNETALIFADSEVYWRTLNKDFYTKLVSLLKDFDLQKEINCNPTYLVSYCVAQKQ